MTLVVSLLFLLIPLSSAQIGSLAVWENIADGSLVCNWYETGDSDWSPYNDSGTWQYNCSSNTFSVTVNNTTIGDRWYHTFEATSNDATAGIASLQTIDLTGATTSFYAVVYYLSFEGGSPATYIIYRDDGTDYYWNESGGLWDEKANGTNYYGQEVDYYSDFIRFKALWNWADLDVAGDNLNCTVRFKFWDPASDEPVDWMVDDAFTMYGSTTAQNYYSGIGADGTNDPALTKFRRIMFWNLSFDYYDEETQIPQIACPTISATNFFDYWNAYYDTDDFWNSTQVLTEFLNIFDLISFYDDDQYDGVTDQNDTTYTFSLMIVDIDEFIDEFFDEAPDWLLDFPDNLLFVRTYFCPDGSENDSDFGILRIDTDNNANYDDYDMAYYIDGTGYDVYLGDEAVVSPEDYCYLAVGAGGLEADMFRGADYLVYTYLINWDLVYNGTSEERVGTDICRMSLGWYNKDTDVMSVLADFDEENDTTMLTPASESDDWAVDDNTTFWLYFYVDESISGDEMADPDDPTTPSEDLDEVTGQNYGFISKLLLGMMTIFIAMALIYYIIVSWTSKKNKKAKDLIEMIKLIVFVMIGLIIVSMLIAVF